MKEPDRFATEIIPNYFKHNNFSSFVRQVCAISLFRAHRADLCFFLQLNFYGFRKIKSDPLRLKDAETSEESKWWKFRHEKFVEGRPDLLLQIKKHSSTNESAVDRQDVDHLKGEVKDLKSLLNSAVREIGELKATISSLKKENELKRSSVFSFPSLPPAKKRRTSTAGESWPVLSASVDDLIPVPAETSSAPPPDVVDSPAIDDEMLAFIGALGVSDGTIPDNFDSPTIPDVPLSDPSLPDEDKKLAAKLDDAFSKLPSSLKTMFVERLVALVSNPDEFKKQADALSRLALVAAEQASTQSTDDIQNVRLGAAILGAYLAQLGSSAPPMS